MEAHVETLIACAAGAAAIVLFLLAAFTSEPHWKQPDLGA